MTYRDVETQRLRIVRFSERHLTPRYLAWLNDPHRTRYSEQRHRQHTMASCRAYLAGFDGSPNYFWAIETRVPEHASLGHIGNINAYVDPHAGVADLGILIGSEGAGHGFGLEAWQGVSDFLLREGNIRKVCAGTLANNAAMIQLAEKAGMAPDGVRRAHAVWQGKPIDVLQFARFREDGP